MTQRDQPRRTGPSLCALLIALFTSLAGTHAAQAGTITIEWDRSPDPSVIGYRVAVGTSPGVYTETFDVGSATAFVYQTPDTRLYYLAVASYAEGPLVGPFSAAVSAIPAPDARSFYQSLWRDITAPGAVGRFLASVQPSRLLRRSTIAATAAAAPPGVCWTGSTGCLSVRTVTHRSAEITSIAVSPDTRVFFVEAGQRINVVASGVLLSQPVLVPHSPTIRLDQVSLDAAFAITGLIYVAETEMDAENRRHFRIVRYRVHQNRAQERTVVVAIPLPSSGRASFAMSSNGYLYVTVPSADAETRSENLLRFHSDGTVPAEQGGRAAIAVGHASPRALAFDEYAQRVWMAGVDERNQASITTLGGPSTSVAAPVTSLSAMTDSMGRTSLFVTSTVGILGTARAQPDGTLTDAGELRMGSSPVRTVTATPSGDLFVAVANESSTADTSFSILQLTPLPELSGKNSR